MSGHSHAKTVKRTKDLSAKKRSQDFSKVARLIFVAAKEAGPNPETNSKLRLAIETAHSVNMPKENIERMLQKASGETSEENLEEVIFEAFGPGGVAVIIEGITDNKNRTLGEIKKILSRNEGKLAAEGAVRWMFDKKGYIIIKSESQNLNCKSKEFLELSTIEAGAEDFSWDNDFLEVYTRAEELEKVKNNLEEKEIKIDSALLAWVAKERTALDEKTGKSCQKLFEELDENEAVQEVYSNIKL